MDKKQKIQIDWKVSVFLFGVIGVSLVSTPVYLYNFGFDWKLWLLALIWAGATNISITAGYHRLFAHRSYEAHPLFKYFLLFFSTSAWQGSAFDWVSSHRTHHRHQDRDRDPYNIHRGFLYAHMGWMLQTPQFEPENNIADLKKDRPLVLQQKYYIPLAICSGFVAPALVASLFGQFWGGLFIAGFLRVALTQQSTWFVNSLCHTVGSRPFSNDISARDSFWVALLTQGEGYHNYHHKFEADYRNGISPWSWDPTKWLIFSVAKMGLAQKLRRISAEEILKARLNVEALKLRSKGFSNEKLEDLKHRILEASEKMRLHRESYRQASN